MCVCMCVCACRCMCSCVHVCVHVFCVQLCVCMCMCAAVCRYVHVCMCVCSCVQLSVSCAHVRTRSLWGRWMHDAHISPFRKFMKWPWERVESFWGTFLWLPMRVTWSSFVFTGGDASDEDSSPPYRVLWCAWPLHQWGECSKMKTGSFSLALRSYSSDQCFLLYSSLVGPTVKNFLLPSNLPLEGQSSSDLNS